MNLSLIDLHCDTLYEIYAKKKAANDPHLAVQLKYDFSDLYEFYWQVGAIWSDSRLSDEDAFKQCMRILQHLNEDFGDTYVSIIPAVEDARILAEDIDRLFVLYQKGVRFLTLLWKGLSCIGGAYDTYEGLTPFGKRVVTQCTRLGGIPDLSHASYQSAYDILEHANGSAVVASHSNSFSVFPHPRNLRDDLFEEIRNCGGLVGINLCQSHLGIDSLKESDIDTVLRHVERFLALGGENTLCFGCDFDGAVTPRTLQRPQDLVLIANEMLRRGYAPSIIEKLFWKNAKRFMENHIFI